MHKVSGSKTVVSDNVVIVTLSIMYDLQSTWRANSLV